MEIIKRTCLEQSKNFFYLFWINIKWKSKANDTFSWENRTNLKELDIQSRYTKQYGFCQHNFCSIKTKLCHETDKLHEVANFKIFHKVLLPTPSIFKSTQSEFKRWIVKNLWLQLKISEKIHFSQNLEDNTSGWNKLKFFDGNHQTYMLGSVKKLFLSCLDQY